MGIENPPTYETDSEKAKEMAYEDDARRKDLKRAEEMAYAEKGLRGTLADIKNLTVEQKQLLNNLAKKKGEGAGQDYDKKRRQSFQGLEDQLPYYKKTALQEMESDMAERMLKADNADKMAEIANGMIATQESVAEDEKYVKKMSPLEWVNYRADKIRDEKKAPFARNGVSDDILKTAGQENLNRATKALSDKEAQILHLKGLIKGEVANSRNTDFTAVSENAPRLKELELEEIKLEKEVETTKLWLKDLNSEKEKIKEAIAGTEIGEKGTNKPLEEGGSKEVGDKSKISLAKVTEIKTGSSDSVEAKPGKGAKRELPGWLKIFFQMMGGLVLIGWSALFGFLEKQVPGGRKGKKE